MMVQLVPATRRMHLKLKRIVKILAIRHFLSMVNKVTLQLWVLLMKVFREPVLTRPDRRGGEVGSVAVSSPVVFLSSCFAQNLERENQPQLL